MTLTLTKGEPPPVDLVAFSENLFLDTAERLSALIQRLEDGETAKAAEGVSTIKELRNLYQIVEFERERLEKLRKQISGAVAAGDYDLHAARDEIGRRLACLRDAGGGG